MRMRMNGTEREGQKEHNLPERNLGVHGKQLEEKLSSIGGSIDTLLYFCPTRKKEGQVQGASPRVDGQGHRKTGTRHLPTVLAVQLLLLLLLRLLLLLLLLLLPFSWPARILTV